MKKSILTLFMILVIIFVVGCGSSKGDYATDKSTTESIEESADYGNDMLLNDTLDNENTDGRGVDLSNRKIIENRFIVMESLEFDHVTKEVEMLVKKYFGYIEKSQVSGIALNNKSRYNTRYGNYTLRIPAEYFSDFVHELKDLGNVLTNELLKKDVTMQYFDLEARINTLEVQEERLLELLESGGKLSDILEIENKLADVRYEIESYTATLKNLDNQVRYGTIELEIREVYEETEVEERAVTVGEKISKGFTHSITTIKNFFIAFFIWFITAIPYLVIWALFILIVVFIIKKIAKKNEIKRKHYNVQTKNKDIEKK